MKKTLCLLTCIVCAYKFATCTKFKLWKWNTSQILKCICPGYRKKSIINVNLEWTFDKYRNIGVYVSAQTVTILHYSIYLAVYRTWYKCFGQEEIAERSRAVSPVVIGLCRPQILKHKIFSVLAFRTEILKHIGE